MGVHRYVLMSMGIYKCLWVFVMGVCYGFVMDVVSLGTS